MRTGSVAPRLACRGPDRPMPNRSCKIKKGREGGESGLGSPGSTPMLKSGAFPKVEMIRKLRNYLLPFLTSVRGIYSKGSVVRNPGDGDT